MKRMIRVKAVIFDMDGVITDTMDYHVRANVEAMRTVAGVRITRRDVLLWEGKPGARFFKELLHRYGHAAPRALIRRISAEKKKIFHRILKQRYVKGSRPFLRGLLRRGIRLALVTGSTRHELENTLPAALRAEFTALVTGDDVRHGKPHGEPYRKALAKLKLHPREAFVIENAPLGIESARKARIPCAALTTTLKRADLRKADYLFASFEQLKRSLDFRV